MTPTTCTLILRLVQNQIAFNLKMACTKIKRVTEWVNCYFVEFFVGKARFVSKKGIQTTVEATEEVLDTEVVYVVAVTAKREGKIKGFKNSRGLLVRNIKTGEQSWVNNYRLDICDASKGQKVQMTLVNQTYSFAIV